MKGDFAAAQRATAAKSPGSPLPGRGTTRGASPRGATGGDWNARSQYHLYRPEKEPLLPKDYNTIGKEGKMGAVEGKRIAGQPWRLSCHMPTEVGRPGLAAGGWPPPARRCQPSLTSSAGVSRKTDFRSAATQGRGNFYPCPWVAGIAMAQRRI